MVIVILYKIWSLCHSFWFYFYCSRVSNVYQLLGTACLNSQKPLDFIEFFLNEYYYHGFKSYDFNTYGCCNLDMPIYVQRIWFLVNTLSLYNERYGNSAFYGLFRFLIFWYTDMPFHGFFSVKWRKYNC